MIRKVKIPKYKSPKAGKVKVPKMPKVGRTISPRGLSTRMKMPGASY